MYSNLFSENIQKVIIAQFERRVKEKGVVSVYVLGVFFFFFFFFFLGGGGVVAVSHTYEQRISRGIELENSMESIFFK